jgi:hypothetical protein
MPPSVPPGTLNQPSHEATPFSMDTSPSPVAAASSLSDPNMADSRDLISLAMRLKRSEGLASAAASAASTRMNLASKPLSLTCCAPCGDSVSLGA